MLVNHCFCFLIADNSSIHIISGTLISFWSDKWIGEKPLKFLFPSLFKISNLKNGSVCEHICFSYDNLGDWNLHFKRALNDLEAAQVLSLLDIIGLHPPHLCELGELLDYRKWS